MVHWVRPEPRRTGCTFFSLRYGTRSKEKCNHPVGEMVILLEGERLSASEDEASVEMVLAGDINAFEGIVRRWHRPLINLAYRFCRDPGRAEELAQEALLRSYRALHQWRKDAAFSTWLFALTTNFYRSELRRTPITIVSIEEAVELEDPRARDGGLEDRDRDQAVRELVHMLPEKYRDVILLYYFHEMDVAACAKSLDLAEGTVKARLARARDMLRTKLSHALTPKKAKEP